MGEKTRGFVYVDVDGLLPLAEQAGGTVPPDAKDADLRRRLVHPPGERRRGRTKVSGFVRLNG